jgi:4-amino-4-deoxy-L-arabinose transferase-like glycosyltransferase
VFTGETALIDATAIADVQSDAPPRVQTTLLLLITLAAAIFHIVTNGRYGFHRDELQVLSDAHHLDWGFVPYPPMTPFLENISLHLFGLSLIGLRLFSVIAQSLAIFVTGRMAWELGGHRLAQITAALSVALSPLPIFEATEFQYSSFDLLWWVLIAYFVIRLLKTEDPRYWLAIGATIGLGLQTKYTILFFITGLLAGLVFTSARRYLLNRWFWSGVALALLIFLPNLLWQVRHEFISYHFLHHIHVRDVAQGRANGFLRGQFLICANLFAAPLWIAGLFGYFRNRRYRMLAWMYVVPFALFVVAKGRDYYLAAAYPMLIAMGAVVAERWLARMSRVARSTLEVVYYAGLVSIGIFAIAFIVPLQSSGPLKQFALGNNGDLREEFGWTELVKTVADIRDSLPLDQQQHLGIIVGNYGEQGAIEIYGPAYHLPPPISMTNSAWLRGYPTPQPTTLIVIGFSKAGADKRFTGCRWAGHNGNSEGIKNEESRDYPDIFLCGPPILPWPQYWEENQRYG